MAVDLFCYSTASPKEAVETLASLMHDNQEFLGRKFLFSTVREASQIHKEIALDYGMSVHSFFMISLNEKSAANRVIDVVNLAKNYFRKYDLLVLHGNEKNM